MDGYLLCMELDTRRQCDTFQNALYIPNKALFFPGFWYRKQMRGFYRDSEKSLDSIGRIVAGNASPAVYWAQVYGSRELPDGIIHDAIQVGKAYKALKLGESWYDLRKRGRAVGRRLNTLVEQAIPPLLGELADNNRPSVDFKQLHQDTLAGKDGLIERLRFARII